MIHNSSDMEMQAVLQTAARMCASARTAPKAHGKDTLHTMVLTGEDKDKLADSMDQVGSREMGDKMTTWYGRDAANVRTSQAVVLIGAEKKQRGVPHCGFCGFADCKGCKEAQANCGFTYIDLGIAVSSAVSVASQEHVDCRIMYSIGKTAEEMAYIPNYIWLGIPLSVSGKNIFFDRGIVHD
ncbi:MAG: DUF2148 domain-containing protein [Clostridiales bacterium]|nr:DUF2148 domain-containing protein [Clostridiales bacterium]